MTIDDIYEFFKYAISKNAGQGNLPPNRFNLVIAQAEKAYMSWLLGSFQQYQQGRAIAKVELGQNATIRQRLSPVIYMTPAPLPISGGAAVYPEDFVQVDAMYMADGFTKIKLVQQDRVGAYVESEIDPIASNPIYLITDTGFTFYPQNLTNFKMSYIRTRPTMEWGFSEDGNGRYVYNAASSVQPIWDDIALQDIIMRGLRVVGLNLQAREVEQYSNEMKNVGV